MSERTDTERLDWLSAMVTAGWEVEVQGLGVDGVELWCPEDGGYTYMGQTLRDAIDNAEEDHDG